MNVEIFALCDAATDSQGKLNVLGAFDTINAAQVPVQHPHCSVALRLRFRKIEQGEHKITIHLVDEDGQLVLPSLDAGVKVSVPQNRDSTPVNMVLNIQGLELEKYGRYAVNLAVDARQEASIPLHVRRRQTSQ